MHKQDNLEVDASPEKPKGEHAEQAFVAAKRQSRYSLRFMLPLATFVLTLSLMLGAGFSFYSESQRIVLEQEVEDLSDESELFKLLFERVYQESASDVSFLSGTPPIQAIIQSVRSSDHDSQKASKERLQIIFSEMLKANPNYNQLRYIGLAENGKELVSVTRKSDGIYIAQASELQSKGHRSYFKESTVLNANQVYFSPIELNRERGEIQRPFQPVLRVAVPIYEGDSNRLFGIVIVNVDMNVVFESLENIEVKELVFYLSNADGDFLYHPDVNERFGFELGKNYKMQTEFPELAPYITNSAKRTGFSILADTHGSKLASFYIEISLDQYGSPLKLRMLLRHRGNVAALGLKAYRNQTLILGGIAALLVMGLALVVVRRIIAPLGVITNAVEQYESSGDLKELPVERNDEIGVLSRSFKKMLNNLEESHQRNEALAWRTRFALKAPGIGVWEYDITDQTLIWDERMYELYGTQKEEFSGAYEAWENGVHPSDRDSATVALEESVLSGEDFDTEYRVCWPNGEIRHIEAHGKLIHEQGKNVRMVGTNTDITHRKETEQELFKLSRIANQTDNAVVVTNIDGEIEWVNDAFTLITGFEPLEVVGKKPGSFLQGEATDLNAVAQIREALKKQEPCQVEILNYSKQQEHYWIELRINPMFDEDAELIGFMALEMDISQRKQADQKLKRQQDMLESMSSQGTTGAWEVDLVREKVYWSTMTKRIHEVDDQFEPDLATGINFYKEGESRELITKRVTDGVEMAPRGAMSCKL